MHLSTNCSTSVAVWLAVTYMLRAPARWRECRAIAVGAIGFLLIGSAPGAQAQDVRVRIFDRLSPRQVDLVSSRRIPVHTSPERAPLFHIEPGSVAELRLHRGDVRIAHGSHRIAASTLYLNAPSRAATTLRTAGAQRSYTGAFEIRPDGETLEVVNAVPLEQYVASVVASEYGLDDVEGAKAMAVVARTYAVRGSDKFDGAYAHVDHTISQVYRGMSAITDASRAAARATAGEVLTYNSHLIEAVYFSSSGGHTANNEDVWDASDELPYLRGRQDPYDAVAPHHTWQTSVSRAAVLRGLERQFGGSVRGFYLGDASSSGRLLTLELLRPSGAREPVEAGAFRRAVNRAAGREVLRSTWFEARREGSRYVFDGRGYGHGVGMSQWGAHGMAQSGRSYRDILAFYYQGATLTQLDNAERPPAQLALDDTDSEEPPPAASTSTRSRSGRIGW